MVILRNISTGNRYLLRIGPILLSYQSYLKACLFAFKHLVDHVLSQRVRHPYNSYQSQIPLLALDQPLLVLFLEILQLDSLLSNDEGP